MARDERFPNHTKENLYVVWEVPEAEKRMFQPPAMSFTSSAARIASDCAAEQSGSE